MKPLIIVVDDNKDLLFTIQFLLENNNFDVITAGGGTEALNKLENAEQLPDLILCDILMPELNGYDFFNQVRGIERFQHIPFIFLSALSFTENNKFKELLENYNILSKPLKLQELINSINKTLNL